jgi:toxin ParE1/3/4
MSYKFHPAARVDYLEAIAYYETRQSGLGARFTVEIEKVIQRIVEAPSHYRIIEGDIRRALARTFPYGVLYSIEADHVLILAVMHHSRKPGYWRDRLDPLS